MNEQDLLHDLQQLQTSIDNVETIAQHDQDTLQQWNTQKKHIQKQKQQRLIQIWKEVQVSFDAIEHAYQQEHGKSIHQYATFSQQEKQKWNTIHQTYVKQVEELMLRWKDILHSSTHNTLLGEDDKEIQQGLLTWFSQSPQGVNVFRKGVQRVKDSIVHNVEQQKNTLEKAFFNTHITKSQLHKTLFQLDTLQQFGTSNTSLNDYLQKTTSNTNAFEEDHRAFQNADTLKEHLKQLLHVGETHMMTHEAFEQQLDWNKTDLGFESQLQQLKQVHALRVSQMVKQSQAMKDLLNAHHIRTTPQWIHKLTSPHVISRLNTIHNTLQQLQNVVQQVEPFQDLSIDTRMDSIDQKFVALKYILPNKVFSWFNLEFVKQHRSKLNILTKGYTTDPHQLAKEEFAFVHREDIDAHYIRKHMPDPLHRRMHFLYLYCKHMQHHKAYSKDAQHEADEMYRKAMEQFALHQPESFAKFIKTFEQDHQWMEANVYSSKSQFTWGSALFDMGTSLLGQKMASTNKSLTKHQIHKLTTFFSKKDTKTLLLEDIKGLEGLKDALRHSLQKNGQRLQDVLDHLPQVVLNGDNPL
ncbi:MAG TPA: hypothetical protein EYO58_09090, partial [Flavobacteriales bacterium]|nr:hypothetical protein [Flavobacteriales bacterium]